MVNNIIYNYFSEKNIYNVTAIDETLKRTNLKFLKQQMAALTGLIWVQALAYHRYTA